METRISVLFYTKKKVKTVNGKVPIYFRITIDGARFEKSIYRLVDSDKWISKVGKVKGPTKEASILNNYLDSLRNKAFNYQQEIWREGNELTVATFRAKWLGIKEKPITLTNVFLEHNRKMKELVGKEYARLRYIRYETSLEHTKKFLRYKYAVDDIDVKKLDYEFISEFAFWLKSVRNFNQNSTIKYLSNFKKIVNLCIQNGFIQRNPFAGFKLVKKEVVMEILSNEELEKMASLKFKSQRSEHVRDIFLFCCYTQVWRMEISKS